METSCSSGVFWPDWSGEVRKAALHDHQTWPCGERSWKEEGPWREPAVSLQKQKPCSHSRYTCHRRKEKRFRITTSGITQVPQNRMCCSTVKGEQGRSGNCSDFASRDGKRLWSFRDEIGLWSVFALQIGGKVKWIVARQTAHLRTQKPLLLFQQSAAIWVGSMKGHGKTLISQRLQSTLHIIWPISESEMHNPLDNNFVGKTLTLVQESSRGSMNDHHQPV